MHGDGCVLHRTDGVEIQVDSAGSPTVEVMGRNTGEKVEEERFQSYVDQSIHILTSLKKHFSPEQPSV